MSPTLSTIPSIRYVFNVRVYTIVDAPALRIGSVASTFHSIKEGGMVVQVVTMGVGGVVMGAHSDC